MCIDINIEISEVDHYTWIFTSRIFRFSLEITFFFNKYFFLQMVYELLSQSRKLNKRGEGGSGFLIRALIRDTRVLKSRRHFVKMLPKAPNKYSSLLTLLLNVIKIRSSQLVSTVYMDAF